MKFRTIAWLLAGALTVLGSWLVITPGIDTATIEEVRAHAAPELLLPLPHPDGGLQRREAVEQALRDLYDWRRGNRRVVATRWAPLELGDPEVRRVIEILEAGPLDRSVEVQGTRASFITYTRGLTAAALVAADQHDWERVRRQMDAAFLVLDRLTGSDIVLDHPVTTMTVETAVYKAILDLAKHRELPAALATHWSAQLAIERHSPQQVRQFLRGDFQLVKLREIPAFEVGDSRTPRPWLGTGTYDPLETATLISDSFVELGNNAALPVSRWSNSASERIRQLQNAANPQPAGLLSMLWLELTYRARANNSTNTLGRMLAGFGYTTPLMNSILKARTRREQVAAALATARFRQRKGRDPAGFDELIEAGLLQSIPQDHARERPQAFDLKALFEWPAPGPRRN